MNDGMGGADWSLSVGYVVTGNFVAGKYRRGGEIS